MDIFTNKQDNKKVTLETIVIIGQDKMIDGLQTFQPDRWEDFRGDIYTTWDSEKYPKLNWRLDKFYLLVADNRKDSPTYKKWDWFILSAENRKQVLVPPGCGNGHFVLSDDCVFHYKLAFDGDYNDVENQFVIKWDGNDLPSHVIPWSFEWPHKNPILFGRDK